MITRARKRFSYKYSLCNGIYFYLAVMTPNLTP